MRRTHCQGGESLAKRVLARGLVGCVMIWQVAGSDSNRVVIPGLVQLGSAKTTVRATGAVRLIATHRRPLPGVAAFCMASKTRLLHGSRRRAFCTVEGSLLGSHSLHQQARRFLHFRRRGKDAAAPQSGQKPELLMAPDQNRGIGRSDERGNARAAASRGIKSSGTPAAALQLQRRHNPVILHERVECAETALGRGSLSTCGSLPGRR